MEFHESCGKIAGLLSAIAFIPYVVSILQGKTKPSRVTWLVWLVVGVNIYASYKTVGAFHATWVTISYVIGPLVVVCLSFRYGVGGWAKLDIACLSGALIGVLLWWYFDSPSIALFMNVAMDFLGLLPTLKKSWLKPQEESRFAWTISALSACINLMALSEWSPDAAIYPLYMFLGNGSVCIILWLRWFLRLQKKQQ